MRRFVLLFTLPLLIGCEGESPGGLCDPELPLNCQQIPGVYTPCERCGSGAYCYDQLCVQDWPPACMDSSHPDFAGWPEDSALEPNSHPDIAHVLPCGDDGVFADPVEYQARCPSRDNLTITPVTGVICPNADRDFYAFYLMPEETATIQVNYQYSTTLPRDVDAQIWRWDFVLNDWRDDVAVGLSVNDNEQLTVTTDTGSNNVQGWYYLEVRGKTYHDLNYYVVNVTLNPI